MHVRICVNMFQSRHTPDLKYKKLCAAVDKFHYRLIIIIIIILWLFSDRKRETACVDQKFETVVVYT